MVAMRDLTVICGCLLLAACEKPVPPVFYEPVPLSLPAAENSLGPRLTVGTDGTILLSWMERRDEGGKLRAAVLGAPNWDGAVDVVDDPRMFVNWADLPSVTALGGGRRVAHWLRYSADLTYSYDVLLSQSTDAGATWSEPLAVHDDGTPTEHGFVSVWPRGDDVGLLWLDGRKTVNEVSDDPRASGMTLRAAFLGANGAVGGAQQIDGLVCECCQTDVAVTASGPIAVYRNRTTDEIRDISFARFVDGRWQSGEPFSADGWEISGCPVNGPAIAANGEFVAVAWFTAAADSPRVYARLSTDGGLTFGDEILVASALVKGHVDIAYIGDSSFAMSWVQRDDDVDDIRVRSITSQGEVGPIKTVGRSAAKRNVPQMVFSDGDLIFAWTDMLGDSSRIVSVRVEVAYAY